MKLTGVLLLIGLLQVSAAGLSQNKRINPELENVPVEKFITTIENQTDYRFVYLNETIKNKLITVKAKHTSVKKLLDRLFSDAGINYKIIHNKLVVITSDEIASTLQQVIVTGTVTDENGEPLVGATVSIKGTTIGTITDIQGAYSIAAPDDATLVISFVGMLTQEIEVGDQVTINVTLMEDVVGIDEVVVIGYGTQRKVNLTSAIQMVDTKDLENRPVKSVLKDAAASAIYGSRAPNEVVLITTKSGKKGKKMQIDFSSDLIVSQPIGIASTVNGYVSAIWRNNRRYNSLLAPLYSDATLERIRQYIDGEISTTNIILPSGLYGGVWEYNANSDHFADAFREDVFNQKYNLSINGGSEQTSYYASIGYVGNEGVYESDDDWLKRYFAVIKANTDIIDWLSVGVSSKYTQQESQRPTIGTSGQNDGNLFTMAGFMPTLPDYDDNGSPNEFAITPNLHGLSGSYNNTTDDLWLMGQMELKPVKGLSVKGDYTWNMSSQFDNNTHLIFHSWNADSATKVSRRSPTLDQITQRYSNTKYHNINLVATYNLDIDKHGLTLLAGYNQELNKYNRLTSTNSEFYTQTITSLSTTYSDSPTVDDVIYTWATRGYFGRLSYNYKETYLLDINTRYDAASKYSPDTRWAFFPSVSAGYNIARENFWPLKEYDNMFKIKGSWGKLGNNTGSNYAYLPTMGTASQTLVILDGGRLPYCSYIFS